ncbi:hypothetical protein Hte_010172 [Hypoxylon texense]
MLSLPPSLLVLLGPAMLSRAQHPTAVRKMSLDEGEKFLPEYYAFGPLPPPQSQQQPLHQARAAGLLTPEEELLLSGNGSAAVPFLPPYPRHYDYHGAGLGARTKERRGQEKGNQRREEAESGSGSGSLGLYRRVHEVLARLQGRQFACPEGTHSCTNIDQPNYCCTTGTTCFVVTNAPDAGNVGCCPEGANCGVTVGTCSDGATACPASLGGGCCIPGFVCAEVGCVSSTVSVITPSQTQTPTQTTVTSTVISSPTPTTQVITVIVTVTPSGGGEPVTSTTTQTTTAGNTNTATSTTNTNTGGGVPPYRPTSGSSTTTEAPPSTSTYCPTGFYACVASAGGGCCRTGRDCSTTSCPAPAMTTIVSNGATIVVPATDAEAAGNALASSATCAGGWFLCGGDAGSVPGCCPSGYACGTASCTLSTSTATATVQKQLPSSAPGSGSARGPSAVVFLAALLFAAVLA